MKLLIVLLPVLMCVSALSVTEKWQEFKHKHGKNYKSALEESKHFAIFGDNLKKIEQHNEKYQKGESSYWMGVNRFTDMTVAEFRAQILLPNITRHKHSGESFHAGLVKEEDIPDEIDWTTSGAVTVVKDQGDCGSCYAFASTASIESAYFLKTKELINLSEQQIVDCSNAYGNEGCGGGFSMYVFDYVKEHGISKLDQYPYVAKDESCRKDDGDIKLASYVHVKHNEDSLKAAVGTVGPISVAVHAENFMYYEGGIFDDRTCNGDYLDHEVLVVGYGTAKGVDFWRFKNSWGVDWGEKGFCRIARNAGDICGIADDPVYPIIA